MYGGTDAAIRKIDAAQYETGTGPWLDALRHLQLCRVDDVTRDRRWRAFAEAATAHGIRSAMSLPHVAGHRGVGALNFYSRRPSGFSVADSDVGQRFAVQAGIVLNATPYSSAR